MSTPRPEIRILVALIDDNVVEDLGPATEIGEELQ